jgi:hypothetical protein
MAVNVELLHNALLPAELEPSLMKQSELVHVHILAAAQVLPRYSHNPRLRLINLAVTARLSRICALRELPLLLLI